MSNSSDMPKVVCNLGMGFGKTYINKTAMIAAFAHCYELVFGTQDSCPNYRFELI